MERDYDSENHRVVGKSDAVTYNRATIRRRRILEVHHRPADMRRNTGSITDHSIIGKRDDHEAIRSCNRPG